MKKTAAYISAFSLIMSMLSNAAFAADQGTAYLSELDFPEEEGIHIPEDSTDFIELPELALMQEDTPNETIYISTVDDLQTLHKNMITSADYSLNKKFVLSNNIDLGGMEWTPIGYNSAQTNGSTSALLTYAFKGIFDGNGNTISNFKITDPQYKYLGFFGSVAGGTVRDLNLENVTVNHSYSISGGAYGDNHYPEYNGLLIGFSNYATIQNCNVAGNISIKNDAVYNSRRYLSTGMITGAGIAQIDNCRTAGTITVNALINTYIGGIFGNAGTTNTYFRGHIKSCSSSAALNGSSSSPIYAGGIIGRSSTSIDEVSDCSFSSDISIENRRANGGITNEMPAYAGGIAGYSYSPILRCTGGSGKISVYSDSAPNVGGIAGRTAHRIDRCIVNSSMTSTLSDSANSSTPSIGGIAGICGSAYSSLDSLAPINDEETASITNCTVSKNTSMKGISAGSSFAVAGGITGSLYAPSYISNCVCESPETELNSSLSGIYFGGITGYLNGGRIEYCVAKGDFGDNITSLGTLYIGGIAGIARTKKYLTYDMRYGVQSEDFVATMVYGSQIDACAADVNISPASQSVQYLGGIAGYISGIYSSANLHINMDRDLIVENSRYIGDMSINEGSSICHAGGIAGYIIDGKLNNLYAAGNIESFADDDIERYIGGAAGTVKQANHDVQEPVSVLGNCYVFSTVSKPESNAATAADDFCAEVSASTTSNVEPLFVHCYFYSEDGSENKTASPLGSEAFSESASFEGWDFDNVWTMGGIRPILKFENPSIYAALNCSSDPDYIGSIMISRPKAGYKLIAVSKDIDGRIIGVKSVTLNSSNITTSAFTSADMDYAADEDAAASQLYFWSENNLPLMDAQNISDFVQRYK